MFTTQHYYNAQCESPVILADDDDCLYGDLYDVLLEAFNDNDEDEKKQLLDSTMAPGCVSKMQQETAAELPTAYKSELEFSLDQIPLPPDNSNDEQAPANYFSHEFESITSNKKAASVVTSAYDTLDSFELLEQTVRKQKRLSRKKGTDMLRKVLLKRTFDLICEIMDHENGFDDDAINEATYVKEKTTKSTTPAVDDPSPSMMLEINVKHNDYADEYSAVKAAAESGVEVTTNSFAGDQVLSSSLSSSCKRRRQEDDDD